MGASHNSNTRKRTKMTRAAPDRARREAILRCHRRWRRISSPRWSLDFLSSPHSHTNVILSVAKEEGGATRRERGGGKGQCLALVQCRSSPSCRMKRKREREAFKTHLLFLFYLPWLSPSLREPHISSMRRAQIDESGEQRSGKEHRNSFTQRETRTQEQRDEAASENEVEGRRRKRKHCEWAAMGEGR